MKTLNDLKIIKDELNELMSLRDKKEGYKVYVAMGEVGLENGARKVLNSLADEVYNKNLRNVTVLMDGNLKTVKEDGVVVKVVDPEGKVTLYGKLCEKCAKKIISEHIEKGQVVAELAVEKCGE